MPVGRTQIEWECELGVVIGRPASRVAQARAMDYVFGYTLENDMSDRGGRGDTRFGSDWLITKNHDTFAPLGPFLATTDDGYAVIRVITLEDAVLDAATGALIECRLFARWLDARRQAARVEWYWGSPTRTSGAGDAGRDTGAGSLP